MKRKLVCSILIAVLVLSLSVCLFAACDGGSSDNDSRVYVVTFLDGDTVVSEVSVTAGQPLKASDIPAAPEGHEDEGAFVGWFYGTRKVEANYVPQRNITAIAKYSSLYKVNVIGDGDFTVSGINAAGYNEGDAVVFSVTVNNPSRQIKSVESADVAVTDNGNGNFSFTMPAKNVAITVTLENVVNNSKHTVTVDGSSIEVSGIDDEGYSNGETVSFTITVTDSTKEINTVTATPTSVALADNGNGNYSFVMPATNVRIFVTLKEKSVIEPEDGSITLMMYGPLYDSVRAVYAFLPEGVSGDLVWEISDETIVSMVRGDTIASGNPIQGEMPEVLLSRRNPGTTVVRCYLESNPDIYGTIEVVSIDKNGGEAMPDEVYNKITGSVKFQGTDQCLSFTNGDKTYDRHIDEEYSLNTIYEEYRDDSDLKDYPDDPEMALRPYNVTDGYQFETAGINGTSHENDISCTYVSNGSYVCVESVDVNNDLILTPASADDDDSDSKIRWYEGSIYYNFFQGKDGFSSADKWRTFDGGKTYHFTGTFLQAEYLTMSLFLMRDTAPDDMWITVDNGTPTELHFVIDPSNGEGSEKYGREVSVAISECGTAKIDHIDADGDGKVFEHESYHDNIDAARAKMAALQNYTVVYEFDDAKYEFKYTEDTIDQLVYELHDGSYVLQYDHSGAHKTADDSYYEYTYDADSKTVLIGKQHNSAWNSDDVHRYPTFDFASELFEDLGDGVYQSRMGTGVFIKNAIFSPIYLGYFKFKKDGTLKINDQGYITEMQTEIQWYETGKVTLTVKFSDFNTTTLEGVLDFENAKEPDTPLSWDQDKSGLYENMQAWHMPELPYLYPQNGWKKDVNAAFNSPGWKDNPNAHIATNKFDNREACDKFLADYIKLLEADGWTATEEKEADTNYTIYKKGELKLSIGRDYYTAGYATYDAVRITVYSKDITVA